MVISDQSTVNRVDSPIRSPITDHRSLASPLEEIEWIPRPKLLALRRLEIETVEDLLTHYPRRWEDRHEFPRFPREESDGPVCLCGEVVKTSVRRFGGWKKIFEATLEEATPNALSEPLVCRWFNLHYIQKMIATGQRLVVFGKPKVRGKRMCMDHPEFEVIEDDAEMSIHFRRITPIYPATEGLSQRVLRAMIYRLLSELSDQPLETLLPPELASGDRRSALRAIHFPETWEARDAAREHLVLTEFFALQMLIASRRYGSAIRASQPHCGNGVLLSKFLGTLPFALTKAQSKVIAEIRRDLAAPHQMNRLLQGDVGSGKTVVAIAAMLLAIEAGYQAALMAPTQILAEQHYGVLRRWLDPLGVCVALRTAARQEQSGPLPLFDRSAQDSDNARASLRSAPASGAGAVVSTARASKAQRNREKSSSSRDAMTYMRQASFRQSGTIIARDEPQIVVGTHALLYESVSFSDLGLAVVDEQHKFGVAQRARLTAREPAPDVLVMTATPIPRTLTMTIYGDLDVSTIDEMPRNRGKIVTAVRDESKLPEV